MYLTIKISQLSNLLFFAQKAEVCDLIKIDLRQPLQHLADSNINRLFYEQNENKLWKQIEKTTGTQKLNQIREAIILLDPVFTSHWHKAHKHLLSWKQYFQDNQLLFEQVIFDIKKLNGVKHFSISKIPIYLVCNPCSKNKEIGARFSWTQKESFIVVEIPLNLKVSSDLFPLAILAHEFFHLILRKREDIFLKINTVAKENEVLFTKIAKGMPSRIFMEELLNSSFVPEGYLSEKYFNIKVASRVSRPKDLLGWRKFIASMLYSVAKKYTNDSMQIDEKYLKNLMGVIKQNKK